jgi:DNA repair exonuclease SbcCD ATPase subunit
VGAGVQRGALGEVQMTRGALESAIMEWREALDGAETRAQTALASEVARLEEGSAALREELLAECDNTRRGAEEAARRLEEKLEGEVGAARAEAAEAAARVEQRLEELAVRVAATEQLLSDEVQKAEAAREAAAVESARKILELQEETAETLVGFRDYLDTEVERISDAQTTGQEKLGAAIEQGGEALRSEVQDKLGELESRVLGSSSAAVEAAFEALSERAQQAAATASAAQEKQAAQLAKVQAEMGVAMQALRIRTTAAEERGAGLLRAQEEAITGAVQQLATLAATVVRAADLAPLTQRLGQLEKEAAATRTRRGPPPPPPGVSPRELAVVQERVAAVQAQLGESEQAQRTLVTRLQERVQRAHGRAQECVDALSKVEATMGTSVQSSVAQLREEMAALGAASTERVEAVRSHAEGELARIDAASQSMGGAIQAVSAHTVELQDGLGGQIKESGTQLGQARRQLSALEETTRRQLEEQRAELGRAQERIGGAQEQIEQLRAGVTEQQQHSAAAVQTAEEMLREAVQAAQEAATQASAELDTRLSAELTEAHACVRGVAESVEQKLRELAEEQHQQPPPAELLALQAEVQAMRREVSSQAVAVEAVLDGVKTSRAEISAQAAAIEAAQEGGKASQADAGEVQRLQAALEELKQTVDSHTASLDGADAGSADTARVERELRDALRALGDDVEEQIQAVRQSGEEAEREASKRAQAQAEGADSLRKSLSEAEVKVENAARQLASVKEETQKVTDAATEHVMGEIQSVKQTVDLTQNAARMALKQLKESTGQVEKLKADFEDSVRGLAGSLDEMQDRLGEEARQNLEQYTQLDTLDRKVRGLEATLQRGGGKGAAAGGGGNNSMVPRAGASGVPVGA